MKGGRGQRKPPLVLRPIYRLSRDYLLSAQLPSMLHKSISLILSVNLLSDSSVDSTCNRNLLISTNTYRCNLAIDPSRSWLINTRQNTLSKEPIPKRMHINQILSSCTVSSHQQDHIKHVPPI